MTEHGTFAGYLKHRKNSGIACEACMEAMRRWHRHRRFKVGMQHDASRCSNCGSVFPDHACTIRASHGYA